MKRKTNQLILFELHVDDRTFYVHGIVEAQDANEAGKKVHSLRGKNYYLQIKGFMGKATLKKMTEALKDSIPKDSLFTNR